MAGTKSKSIPGAILGIIGTVFAFIAAFGLALCAEIVDAASGETSYAWAAYVFGLGGAVLGLLGAIFCFRNNILGGIFLLIGVALLIVIGCIMYFSWALIIAMILLGVGGILAFVVKKAIA